MTQQIALDEESRIEVTFLDSQDIVEPDVVSAILLNNAGDPIHTFVLNEDLLQEDIGIYYVLWTPDELGMFSIEFTGEITGSPDMTITREVHVLAFEASLLNDIELNFIAELPTILVDPEELMAFYPDASKVEVAEMIYRYSEEVYSMLGRDADIPLVAYEYVKAATLCALSRIYDYTFSGDASSLSLGDLKISNQSFPRQQINRANAASWCELAAVLREELLRGEANIKSVTKGTRYTNPMPKRGLRSYYGGNGRRSF